MCRSAGRRRISRLLSLRLAPFVVLACFSSCAPRGVKVTSPARVPEAFSSKGTALMPTKWWTAFGDAELDSLVDRALEGNFDLRTVWDRLDQARAVAAKSGAPLLPAVDGGPRVSRTWTKTAGAPQLNVTEYSLGLSAGYEVDLWGRIRSAFDAARLDVYATEEDLHAAAITLVAEVARTWYQLVESRGQLRLLDEQIRTNEKYLEIITLKFRRGQVSATDVLQQRQLVELTKGERIQVESNIRVFENRLAVLLGRAPGVLEVEVPAAFPPLPAMPAGGLPAEWVRRRPDVRAAELRVQAADRRVASAIADQFPKLSLLLNAETSAEKLRHLFDNWLANLAANLVAPIFDAGLRRAEVERTRAVVSERLNFYGEVVLTSLQEVEDAMAQEGKQAEYLGSLDRQLKLGKQSTDETLANYTKGTMDFIRYLTTLLSYQRLQRTYLTAERDLVLFRIALYRALAGGWALPHPAPARVSGPLGPVADPDAQYSKEPAAEAESKR